MIGGKLREAFPRPCETNQCAPVETNTKSLDRPGSPSWYAAEINKLGHVMLTSFDQGFKQHVPLIGSGGREADGNSSTR
jgi:hypothetical protein